MIEFQLSDIPRLLPEILLLVLALLVLGSDIFEQWGDDEEAITERSGSAASLAALGLGMIFVITLVQSGFVGRLPVGAGDGNPITAFLAGIVRNLQFDPDTTAPILGAFATDQLTLIGRLLFIGSALFVVLLTMNTPPRRNAAEFYTLLIVSTVGACLMAGANELILAFLAIELTSIPLYVLTGYFINRKQSSEAGMKYLLFGAMSSGILLYGMSLLFGQAAMTIGTTTLGNTLTQFPVIGSTIAQAGEPSLMLTLSLLFIIGGLGYKIAVVPFHSWAPDVYQTAPIPVAAFIAAASKAAGFFLLLRLLSTAYSPILVGSPAIDIAGGFGGWTGMLAILAFATLVYGNLAALPQTNVRRLLAYSGIAHAGFLLLPLLAVASPVSADQASASTALLYYLVVYVLMTLGAFGVLAVAAPHLGGDDMRHLYGMARRSPPLAALLTIFVFALAGIPPLAGFLAKFYAFLAGWSSDAYWLIITAVIATVVSLYYYLGILRAIYVAPPADPTPIPVSRTAMVTLTTVAALVLLLGLVPGIIMPALEQVRLTVTSLPIGEPPPIPPPTP